MSEIIVNGGKKIYGGISVQGEKNRVLTQLPGTVL